MGGEVAGRDFDSLVAAVSNLQETDTVEIIFVEASSSSIENFCGLVRVRFDDRVIWQQAGPKDADLGEELYFVAAAVARIRAVGKSNYSSVELMWKMPDDKGRSQIPWIAPKS